MNYLFKRYSDQGGGGEGERERDLLPNGLLPECQHQCQVPGTPSKPPTWVARTQVLRHCPLPPSCIIRRNLDQKCRVARILIVDAASSDLTYCATIPTSISVLECPLSLP